MNYTWALDIKNTDTVQVNAKVSYEWVDAAGGIIVAGHFSSIVEPGVRTKWESNGITSIASWDATKNWRITKVERL